ncbi:R2D2 protein [Leptinotarsa decemlineata]|uniref:R2D2 protein n=1 Tax=Leptinotarsa decemlineata TaxID=7539 RepID=UPI003D30C92A
MAKNTKTPAMVLQELTVKLALAPPTYEITNCRSGTHDNRFDYVVRAAGIEAFGTGSSKQIAKHDAAQNALAKLKDLNIYNPSEIPVQEFKVATSYAPPGSPFKRSPNCIGPLKDMCAENKIPDPIFTLRSDVGPPHCREFTYECKVASITTVATANTKKMAKQIAAQEMMTKIKDVLPELVENYPRKEDTLLALPSIESTEKAIGRYEEMFDDVVIDKTVKVSDFANCFKKQMNEYEKTIDDFEEDLKERTVEALARILDKIGLKFTSRVIQDKPTVICLVVNSDSPFTTIGFGKTDQEAFGMAVSNAFEILDLYLRL